MMPSRTVVGLLAALVTLAVEGCEHEYVYRPTVFTTSAVNGRPASTYDIPPEAPRGRVQLTTFGFAEIRPEGRTDGPATPALHMRMVVVNNDGQPWTVDTRDQLLSLPNHGESRPAYASSDQGTAPIVVVPSGGKRTIDLFYPLPEDMDRAKDLPAFDTLWKVWTSSRLVADRTPFERLEVVPRYAYVDTYDGWGPSYWYDPYYVHGGAFVGVRSQVYVNRPVINSRPSAPPARSSAPPAHRR